MDTDKIDCWFNLSLTDIEGEEWKDIKGYEKFYQISNMGRVKSLKRTIIWHSPHKPHLIKERLLKQNIRDKYLVVTLYGKDGKCKTFRVHGLVAKSFIPNPKNKRTINHKLGNIYDNRADSLEWNTYKENIHHALDILGVNGRKIICLNNGKVYNRAVDAARELKLHKSNICHVCNGERNNTGGYIFRYYGNKKAS